MYYVLTESRFWFHISDHRRCPNKQFICFIIKFLSHDIHQIRATDNLVITLLSSRIYSFIYSNFATFQHYHVITDNKMFLRTNFIQFHYRISLDKKKTKANFKFNNTNCYTMARILHAEQDSSFDVLVRLLNCFFINFAALILHRLALYLLFFFNRKQEITTFFFTLNTFFSMFIAMSMLNWWTIFYSNISVSLLLVR